MKDLVAVRTYGNRFEAEIAKSALEAADIPALIRTDDAGGLRPGLWVGNRVVLVVNAQDFDQAIEILDTPARPRPTLHRRE